ncbi:MAG TPA: protein phosphatase 2C domain-containing protein [Ktedonobacterales bacterium]|nr:protein phosphatase 2C domain-containing protein [Ktedonobacterales bacterium]
MECIQCGAQLRPGARFCNVCGTEQPPTGSDESQSAATATRADQPLTTTEPATGDQAVDMTANTDDTDESDTSDTSGKQKRPPRIPRHRDDEDAISDADTEHAPAAHAAPEPVSGPVSTAIAEPQAAQEQEQPSQQATEPSNGRQATQPGDGGETMPETPNAIPLPDMPTLEHSALAPITAMPKAEPLDQPLPPYEFDDSTEVSDQPSQPVASKPADGLPWPLPPAIIVGGRYRVEELVRSSQTDHGPENIYRAHDLQGYEKCWSCGAEHDIATALDPYCDQCGADMLAREFVLIERLTSEAAAAADAEIGDDARVFTQGLRTYQVAPKPISAIHFPTGVRISGYVTADDGRTRQGEANEDSTALLAFDSIYNSRHDPRVLGIVADGLGGHDSGQEASKLVVRTMLEVLAPMLIPMGGATPDKSDSEGAPAFDGEQLLRNAVRAANVALCGANDAQQADMGSTLVAALIVGETAWIANMGDSRGYVYDDHGLRRVTIDHSLVEQLIDAGMIKPEERYEHPQRNQILKSLGADPRLDADIFPQDLRPGMRILLCSDGVWEMVRDDELARILRETSGAAEACERIVRAANENGGDDNISVVLLDASA